MLRLPVWIDDGAVSRGPDPANAEATKLPSVIAVLGDTHLPRGTRRLPERCVEILREAAAIVHTGDLTSVAVLDELEAFAPVHAVHGNVDDPDVRARLPARLVVELEGLRIGVVHSGGARAGREIRLRRWFPDCEVIAHGHSHLPEIRSYDGCWIVNPGSPTDRRRAPTRTIAVLEKGTPRLVGV
jgi:putative phosphoesterase